MHIIDVRNELPLNKDPKIVWDVRTSSEINKIVVHQSACKNGTTRGIAKYHTRATSDIDGDGIISSWERNHISSKGAPGICYHYTIDYNGLIYKCHSKWNVVWHSGVKSVNETSLGICVLGDFNGPSYIGKEEVRGKQLQSLKFLIDSLVDTGIYTVRNEDILGHCDVKKSKSNCPGTEIMEFIENNYRA